MRSQLYSILTIERMQFFMELEAAAKGAKPHLTWMLSVAPEHMKQLQDRNSRAYSWCMNRMKTKRFSVLDPGLAHPDMSVTAVMLPPLVALRGIAFHS